MTWTHAQTLDGGDLYTAGNYAIWAESASDWRLQVGEERSVGYGSLAKAKRAAERKSA